MQLKKLEHEFSVCQIADTTGVDLTDEFCFLGKTDQEISLVCITQSVPSHTVAREDGWKGFRIQGVLDFSLVGILSRIATLLAENQISIFAISTYDPTTSSRNQNIMAKRWTCWSRPDILFVSNWKHIIPWNGDHLL